MSHRIACYTLFDITKTGVLNRARPGDDVTDIISWYNMRNTQCNFDTILQIVSLRAQPDIASFPKEMHIHLEDTEFGHAFKDKKKHTVWTFDFDIQYSSVFDDGNSELGFLYSDCQNVPMIVTSKVDVNTPNVLDCEKMHRNIYFVKY